MEDRQNVLNGSLFAQTLEFLLAREIREIENREIGTISGIRSQFLGSKWLCRPPRDFLVPQITFGQFALLRNPMYRAVMSNPKRYCALDGPIAPHLTYDTAHGHFQLVPLDALWNYRILCT